MQRFWKKFLVNRSKLFAKHVFQVFFFNMNVVLAPSPFLLYCVIEWLRESPTADLPSNVTARSQVSAVISYALQMFNELPTGGAKGSILSVHGGGRKDSLLRGRPSGGKKVARGTGSSKWSLIISNVPEIGTTYAVDRSGITGWNTWTTSGRAHVFPNSSFKDRRGFYEWEDLFTSGILKLSELHGNAVADL